jgi:hypothetical protein
MSQRIESHVCESLGEPNRGAFLDVLIQLLPTFLGIFQSCKKPVSPAPKNPLPEPTELQSSVWVEAWEVKQKSLELFNEETQSYSPRALRVMARKAKREKKKSGDPITIAEAIEISQETLDEAREQPMEVLFETINEVKLNEK